MPDRSVGPPNDSREGFCTDPDCGPGVRHDDGNEPPILPRDEWGKYADEDATDNLPRYRRGGRGDEPPILSRECCHTDDGAPYCGDPECDIYYCQDCGDEFTEPCPRHVGVPYEAG